MTNVVELYENRCAVCYVPFFQKRRGRLRRTCSDACRQKLYRMRHQTKTQGSSEEVEAHQVARTGRGKGETCPECGGEMIQPKTGRRRKTCSEACRKRRWRRENPKCLVCGKRFKRNKYQKVHLYCSKQCKWRAQKMRERQRVREKEYAKMASYRPDWLPRPGEGYRTEKVPWPEGLGEQEAVLREREPEPNYTPETEAVKMARRREEEQRQIEETLAEIERQKKARELAWELLGDNDLWW